MKRHPATATCSLHSNGTCNAERLVERFNKKAPKSAKVKSRFIDWVDWLFANSIEINFNFTVTFLESHK